MTEGCAPPTSLHPAPPGRLVASLGAQWVRQTPPSRAEAVRRRHRAGPPTKPRMALRARPVLRPGEYHRVTCASGGAPVVPAGDGAVSVPVCTRPGGRMRPGGGGGCAAPLRFQSSSAPEGGCDSGFAFASDIQSDFNPHPPRRADATRHAGGDRRTPHHFNPHPPRRADATPSSRWTATPQAYFNPHPPRRADATHPAPGQGSAATGTAPPGHRARILFQSSSAPEGGCDSPQRRRGRWASPISILIRPGGRMRPILRLLTCGELSIFQSSSAPEGGCDR